MKSPVIMSGDFCFTKTDNLFLDASETGSLNTLRLTTYFKAKLSSFAGYSIFLFY